MHTEWYILEPTTRTYDPRISVSKIHPSTTTIQYVLYVLHNTLTNAAQVHLYRKVLVSHAHTQKPRRGAGY